MIAYHIWTSLSSLLLKRGVRIFLYSFLVSSFSLSLSRLFVIFLHIDLFFFSFFFVRFSSECTFFHSSLSSLYFIIFKLFVLSDPWPYSLSPLVITSVYFPPFNLIINVLSFSLSHFPLLYFISRFLKNYFSTSKAITESEREWDDLLRR